MTMPFCTVEEAIEEIRQGRFLVVLDDESRENEGDLVIAAQHATAEAINFMAKHARGLICVPLSADRVHDLDLPLMTQHNTEKMGTAFTVSVDAKSGVTTGISALIGQRPYGHSSIRPQPGRSGHPWPHPSS